MSKASWDHIRRQVRSFRAAVQAQPPATTLATIKDFCFDDDTDRLYFLANDPSKPGNMNKSLMLYEVDLADFDRSHTTDNPTSTSASSQHTPIKRHHLTTIPSEHQVHSTPASLSGPSTSPTSPPFSPSSSASTTNPTDPAFLATIAALPSAPWRPLFSDGWFRDPDKPNAPASREEQLAKERRRVATQGITCYQFDARTGKVLFGYGGNVYVGSVGRTGDYAPYQICPPPSPLPTPLVLAPNSHLPITSHHHHPYSRSTPSPPPSDPRPPPPLSPRVDPKLGGRHGDLVAFVRHRDIWVSTLQGRETQLTFCSHKDDGTLSCGVAEFVMQEEFHRFTGYYWAPPSPAHNTDRILYLQVSESMVEVVLIPRPGASGPGTNECEKYRYPRAGTANATSDLQIVEFRVPNEREARPGYGPVHKRLWGRCALQELFPWMEYVVRFGWMPDGGSVWVQLLSRAQERSAVVRIPVECFLSATEYREESVAEEGEKAEGAEEKEEKAGADYVDEAGTVEVDGDGDVMMTTQLGNGSGRENAEGERRRERKERWRAGKIEVLWEEVAETWVNVTDVYHFFPTEEVSLPQAPTHCTPLTPPHTTTASTSTTTTPPPSNSRRSSASSQTSTSTPPGLPTPRPTLTRFIWASERTGHRHLYLVTKRDDEPTPRVAPITWGDWSVVDRPLFVDEWRRLVYFVGKRDTPLESHLYVAAFGDEDAAETGKSENGMAQGDRGECPIRRLTALGYSHYVVMDARCHRFVDWFSSFECPPLGVVWWLAFDGGEAENAGLTSRTKNASGRRRKRAVMDERVEVADRATARGTKKKMDRLPHVLRGRGVVIRDPAKVVRAGAGGNTGLTGGNNNNISHSVAKPASAGPSSPLGGAYSNMSHSTLGTLWSAALGKQGEGICGVGVGTGASTEMGLEMGLWMGIPRGGELTIGGSKVPAGEFFEFVNSDGVKIYGCLYKPNSYVPGKSYPTLLSIYGGPKSQMVTNDYKFPRFLRLFLALRLGFAVVLIDSRGSSDRGTAFEAHLRYRMGTVELKDQIEGLRHLAQARIGAVPNSQGDFVSVIDLERVAITGWSYGGYLSLMAIAQYPKVFKIAIAGAPVTQWELYDTAYTERYMGLPGVNAEGYKRGSVIDMAEKFPDEENRLLIAHGLIDENVHFKNTETLVAALVKHNKPHHLQIYPTERHGLRHASVNEHFETLMFYWLVNYL